MTRALRNCLFGLLLGMVVVLPVRAIGLPDLALGPTRLMLAPGGGEAVLALPVENRGDAATAGEIPVRLGRREAPLDPWVWEDLSLAPLPPGGRCPVLVRLPLVGAARELGVAVLIDPADELLESDKTNNEKTLPNMADLLPPPLLEPTPEACSAGTVTIEGLTGCGWEVEALSGSTVAARGESGADGRFALTVPVTPGPNVFAVRAVIGGIWAGRTAVLPPIYWDSTPPILTVDAPVEGAFYRSMTPAFSVTDQLRTEVRLTLDERAYDDGTAVETAGRHVLRITARDAAGNVSSVARSFHIDREPPVLRITGVADGQSANGPLNLRIEARDKTAIRAAFWIDGYLWRNGLPLTIPGRHELTAYAEDQAGNRSRRQSTFTIAGSPVPGKPPTTEALARLLPAGSRLLLAKTGRWTPDPTPASVVFLAARDGAIRLGLIAPSAKGIWLAPGAFGRSNGVPPNLAVQYLDFDGDGVTELAAEGPGPDGRRLVLVRWQAGDWSVIGDFAGENLLLLAGPAGARGPAVVAEKGGATTVWARTNSPSGLGPQFKVVPQAASPAAVEILGTDPGYAFLRPYPAAAGFAKAPLFLCRVDLGQFVLGLQGGKDGYRLVTLQDEQAVPASPGTIAGEAGPSWRWPDPDGLFTADFDGDGTAEPYLTVRQGREWRELLIYDVVDGALKQVFRGRARLPATGYAPGLSFIRRGEEVLIRLGQGAETRLFRWDRAAGSFQSVTAEPAGPTQNLLSRECLVRADVLADLW